MLPVSENHGELFQLNKKFAAIKNKNDFIFWFSKDLIAKCIYSCSMAENEETDNQKRVSVLTVILHLLKISYCMKLLHCALSSKGVY